MSVTKNLTLKKRTKVVEGTFFQLSGATLDILVSLSTKKNSLSAHRIGKGTKKSLRKHNEMSVYVSVVFDYNSLYHQCKQGQSRNVPWGWHEPQSCQRRPLLWISPHTWPGCSDRLASPHWALSGWLVISLSLTDKRAMSDLLVVVVVWQLSF